MAKHTSHFKDWKDAAKWFEKLLDDFHESDQAKVSDQMAVNILLRALSVMSHRLNASANQDVRKKR